MSHSFSIPVLCSGHSRFQVHSGYLVFWLRLSYFSQPLSKKYSESMIVLYKRPEALLSDLPDESFKITLSFNKHTRDATADMADITVSDGLNWWRSSMCYRNTLIKVNSLSLIVHTS